MQRKIFFFALYEAKFLLRLIKMFKVNCAPSVLNTWFHLLPCKRWHLLGCLARTAWISQNRPQLLWQRTSGKVQLCPIALLNKIKIQQSSVKFVFKLSVTGVSFIIYSLYHAIVCYFISCYKRGKTLLGSFQISFDIIALWHLPGLFHNQNTSLLIRSGVLTSGSKYMLLPIDWVSTNFFSFFLFTFFIPFSLFFPSFFSFLFLFSFSFLFFLFFLTLSFLFSLRTVCSNTW